MVNGRDLAQAIKLFKVSFQTVKTNCYEHKAQSGAPFLLFFFLFLVIHLRQGSLNPLLMPTPKIKRCR